MKIATLIALGAIVLTAQTAPRPPQLRDRFGLLNPRQPGTESVMHFFRSMKPRAGAVAPLALAPCSIRMIEVPIETESRMPALEPKIVPNMPQAKVPAPPCPPRVDRGHDMLVDR